MMSRFVEQLKVWALGFLLLGCSQSASLEYGRHSLFNEQQVMQFQSQVVEVPRSFWGEAGSVFKGDYAFQKICLLNFSTSMIHHPQTSENLLGTQDEHLKFQQTARATPLTMDSYWPEKQVPLLTQDHFNELNQQMFEFWESSFAGIGIDIQAPKAQMRSRMYGQYGLSTVNQTSQDLRFASLKQTIAQRTWIPHTRDYTTADADKALMLDTLWLDSFSKEMNCQGFLSVRNVLAWNVDSMLIEQDEEAGRMAKVKMWLYVTFYVPSGWLEKALDEAGEAMPWHEYNPIIASAYLKEPAGFPAFVPQDFGKEADGLVLQKQIFMPELLRGYEFAANYVWQSIRWQLTKK